ncbi:MAG: M48 family metallopeptidase [Candidatus Omnitrophica bacterium]|nr:M48 family metallopeptidase [Candidatus Omnitrophota bacterium]
MIEDTQARRYATLRYRVALLELLGWFLFVWGYHAGGCSAAVAARVEAWAAPFSITLAAYLVVFGIVNALIMLPLRWYGGFVLEHRFGLSRMSPGEWARREAKQLLLSGTFGLLIMEGWYALIRQWPAAWPLVAALGWMGLSVVMTRVFPTWLLRLFYRTEPLRDREVAPRLLALCDRIGLPALGVFRVELGKETRKANAALTGLGRTRRVLVSDTLLESFPPEEIETVLAHELGHHVHRHLVRMLAISGVGSWIALSLINSWVHGWAIPAGLMAALDDLRGFPILLLALSAVGLLGLPIQQAISRAFEWQADRFAVRLTNQPRAFASALKRLGQLNLADPSPPAWIVWLLYDHPPISERIRVAEQGAS